MTLRGPLGRLVPVLGLVTFVLATQPIAAQPYPLCGRDPTYQGDHCYARRWQKADDDLVVAGVGSLSERTDPCVPPECPNPPCTPGGQFSSMAMWLAMQGANVAPWVEIGVIKHDDGNNTGPLVWYGYCGKCGLSQDESWAPWGNWLPASAGDHFSLFYTTTGHCWYWFVNGLPRWRVCDVSFKPAKHIRVGGETTGWDTDMGVVHFFGLQTYYNNSYHKFVPTEYPTNTGTAKHYQGRYRSYYWPFSRNLGNGHDEGFGAEVWTWSDHHVDHTPDACGDTP